MQWSDFTQHEEPFEGELEKDLFFHARRLARLGIDPSTPVIVVGLGPQGHGEEGRVAWTLKYLGVKNVSFASIDHFSLPLTSEEAPPRESKSLWKPQVDDSLLVDRKTMLKLITKPRDTKAPVIVDVRTHQEYLGKTSTALNKEIPDIGAINIPWTEFFDSHGLIVPAMKQKLEAVAITPEKVLYVISEKGVESAAVTLALRELGYTKAANFAGGYSELIKARKK
jgi:thiosulfate/3-mercaptopyruvate sulfurtransferase